VGLTPTPRFVELAREFKKTLAASGA